MFEDERQRVSHRRGAIARGVAKRGLVAFLAFAMAFGTTPAQLWAEGAEGIAEAVAQAAPLAENGSGESATKPCCRPQCERHGGEWGHCRARCHCDSFGPYRQD